MVRKLKAFKYSCYFEHNSKLQCLKMTVYNLFTITTILFHKISADLILNFPKLLLSDWSLFFHPFFSWRLSRQQRVAAKRLKNILSYWYSLIFHSSMSDNNPTDTIEDGQRKQVHSENGIISPFLMRSIKDQVEAGTGNLPKGVSENRKRGRNAI